MISVVIFDFLHQKEIDKGLVQGEDQSISYLKKLHSKL